MIRRHAVCGRTAWTGLLGGAAMEYVRGDSKPESRGPGCCHCYNQMHASSALCVLCHVRSPCVHSKLMHRPADWNAAHLQAHGWPGDISSMLMHSTLHLGPSSWQGRLSGLQKRPRWTCLARYRSHADFYSPGAEAPPWAGARWCPGTQRTQSPKSKAHPLWGRSSLCSVGPAGSPPRHPLLQHPAPCCHISCRASPTQRASQQAAARASVLTMLPWCSCRTPVRCPWSARSAQKPRSSRTALSAACVSLMGDPRGHPALV